VQQPLYLNGAKLIKSTGFAPVIDGMGLIISAISYNGEIIFSFTGCREITPDPEQLSTCTMASFNSLKKAAAAKIAKEKTKAKKKTKTKVDPKKAQRKTATKEKPKKKAQKKAS
jgi:hypothetical protein